MTALSVRQLDLLARIRDRRLVWDGPDLADDTTGEVLTVTDLEEVGDLAERGLVLDALERPAATDEGWELLDAAEQASAAVYHFRSKRESLSLARGWLIALGLSLLAVLAGAAGALLIVWILS